MKKVVTLTMIVLSCSTMLMAFAPKVNATDSLVGYWKFDEGSGNVAPDSSVYGNTGTLMNGPLWVEGISGKALSFDGVQASVFVGSPPSLDIGEDQISVEFWMKPAEDLPFPHSYSVRYIFDKGDAYLAEINNDPANPDEYGKLEFRLPFTTPYKFIYSTRSSWSSGIWYHVALTYDGSSMRIYVNGLLDSSTPATGNVHQSGFNLGIGSRWDAYSGAGFNGVLDEFAIYNYARTPQEILNDYNSMRPSPVGGEWVPINTVQMLVQIVGSAAAITAIAASFVGIRRMKKKQN